MEKELRKNIVSAISRWVERSSSDIYTTEFNKKTRCIEIQFNPDPNDVVDAIEELIDSAIYESRKEGYDNGFYEGEDTASK